MTESDWLDATEPEAMLEWLRHLGKLTERGLRLFGCACVRHVWHLLADERSRRAVEVSERFADGLVGHEEFYDTSWLAWDAVDDSHGGPVVVEHTTRAAAWVALRSDAWLYQGDVAKAAALEAERAAAEQGNPRAMTVAHQSDLLRDIFGSPFRPLPPLAPALLGAKGGAVRRLAQAAYEERLLPSGHLDPARLAVLADALEEAGAPDEVLAHLRSPGPHVRGCAVLDAVLGKN